MGLICAFSGALAVMPAARLRSPDPDIPGRPRSRPYACPFGSCSGKVKLPAWSVRAEVKPISLRCCWRKSCTRTSGRKAITSAAGNALSRCVASTTWPEISVSVSSTRRPIVHLALDHHLTADSHYHLIGGVRQTAAVGEGQRLAALAPRPSMPPGSTRSAGRSWPRPGSRATPFLHSLEVEARVDCPAAAGQQHRRVDRQPVGCDLGAEDQLGEPSRPPAAGARGVGR